jgi:hypothetical protein
MLGIFSVGCTAQKLHVLSHVQICGSRQNFGGVWYFEPKLTKDGSFSRQNTKNNIIESPKEAGVYAVSSSISL